MSGIHSKLGKVWKNQLDKNDIAFIFWDGKSKGSKHTIDLCNKKNIKTIITYF